MPGSSPPLHGGGRGKGNRRFLRASSSDAVRNDIQIKSREGLRPAPTKDLNRPPFTDSVQGRPFASKGSFARAANSGQVGHPENQGILSQSDFETL